MAEFGLEKMRGLKYCYVIGCKYIETMIFMDDDVDNGNQNTNDLLPNLKKLYLEDLPNLKGIWEWEGPSPSPPLRRKCFPSLEHLELIDCPRLKRVFSRGLISHLSSLEWLYVIRCSGVEELFSTEEEEGGEEKILLPRLKALHLDELPKLTRICSNEELSSAAAAGWPSLEKITIDSCESLKRLPRSFSKAPNLQNIKCDARWWETLEWEDDAFKQQLCSKMSDL